MNIEEAIKFLHDELDVDSDRNDFKEYSRQVDKVRDIINLLERIKKTTR